jgi:hypothetical protein
MSSTEKVKQYVMQYLASVGNAGTVFTLRDFNSQVMMNVYAAEERAVLEVALAELVDAGILERRAPTEYVLTQDGRRITAERPPQASELVR